MHISGKLAIIGAILWIVGMVGLFSTAGSFSMNFGQYALFFVIGAIGFFTFVPSLCCYLWKHRED